MAGRQGRVRLPITPVILSTLHRVWEHQPGGFNAVMLWAAKCLYFFGFLWKGKALVPSDSSYGPSCHLSFGDISVDNEVASSRVAVQIKASKTDPFRSVVTYNLPGSNRPNKDMPSGDALGLHGTAGRRAWSSLPFS